MNMRSLFQLGALVLVWLSTQLAWADSYPIRPIRVIVPYAAGGFSDQASRIITDAMSRAMGQPMVIDNRAGGGGRIGSDAVTKMAPDGYNLLMTTNGTHTYMAVTEKNLSYDPINDFTPISLIGTYGLLMVINPTVPAKNLKEFIAFAQNNRSKINYASSGMGSGLHFAGELFNAMAKTQMIHVPYKGSGPGMQDVLAGVCQVIFDGAAKTQIDAGKVRFLGTTSAVRDPRFPDMPTLSESGLTGYDLTYWVGLFGPKGLPLDVQARLQAAVKTTLADPEVQRKLNGLGMTLVGSTPEQMVKEIRVETEKLRAIAAQIPGGIQQ
ncbi:MAG: tripartite tricarboxylate transporter substrate binding protein [Betaproteobacteria bacterium]|nr:tripartite tricarboxylate transporter substrate binding protein [Betaproteobacteria bacterium]NDD13547.1 tripartite tricarboxylate transporter substrate binding protein [Betaproteobacteria bacterium]